LEAQSDIVEMAHMALGHLEALMKKELVLAAMTMTDEEFQKIGHQQERVDCQVSHIQR
jgi:hypothetical protein